VAQRARQKSLPGCQHNHAAIGSDELSVSRTLASAQGAAGLIALWREARVSKDEILARYLNTAYFGAGANGVDAAAQRYFAKRVGSLDLRETAMLAGLVPCALAIGAEP
jgi:membrane carboxypeptidase/penicillin-binding protein